MKNPFILKKLARGIIQKKPEVQNAALRQSLKKQLQKGSYYRLDIRGRTSFTLLDATGVLWDDGSSGIEKIIDNQVKYFKLEQGPSKIRIQMLEDEDELYFLSLKECHGMNESATIIDEELIQNNDFLTTNERYFYGDYEKEVSTNPNEAKWIEGYNHYIVREVDSY